MSEILSKWLNNDVELSEEIEPQFFSELFSTGYLFGELLNRYGLQDDFHSFSTGRSSEARLNNFTKIEPVLSLLHIKFDSNMAKEIIEERPGMATRLLYQLFIALGKKTKMNLTGVAMETMRPQGPARLGAIESEIYKERLKTLVPRQVDLDFDELVTKYNQKQKENEEKAFRAREKEEEDYKLHQQNLRQQGLERSKKIGERQENIMKRIKEATVQIPKPPEQKKKDGMNKKELNKKSEIQSVYKNIDAFEKKLKNMRTVTSPQSSDQIREIDADIELFLNDSTKKEHKISDYVKPEANDQYIQKIRCQLNEDAFARKEREKRRRRVLVQQLQAHEAQQEAVREDALVNRIMRQSQMERRIAVQLMHIRHEKETIKQNRMKTEKQFTERRLQDFQQALDREQEMCRIAKLEYAEEIRKNEQVHQAIAAERARKKYEKHYEICKTILVDIVDFSCRIGEYREITENMLPPKLVREWKTLFMSCKPLYEKPIADELTEDEKETLEIEETKRSLLDEEDFLEYKNFVGEWIPCEGCSQPPKDNAVLGYILKRLNNIMYPPTPPPSAPIFPPFPIKACVVGKFFSGKSSAIRRFAADHRVKVLEVETVVSEAVEAWKNEEREITAEEEPSSNLSIENEEVKDADGERSNEDCEEKKTATTPLDEENQQQQQHLTNPDKNTSSSSRPVTFSTVDSLSSDVSLKLTESKETALTARAKLGGKVSHFLRKGKVIPDTLLVDILVGCIRKLPEGTGWIMDGFPSTSQQAKLLEKALTGFEAVPSPQKSATKEGKRSKRSKIAPDPTPAVEVKAPTSGIDVVVLFDVPDQVVLKRIEGRAYDPSTGEEFHEEFDPPPEGCYTGLQSNEKIQSVVDLSNDKEQAQSRLTSFQDNWPKLEKWFMKFQSVLQTVDANIPTEELSSRLAEIMDGTIEKLKEAKRKKEEEEERLRREKEEQLEKEQAQREKETLPIEPEVSIETVSSTAEKTDSKEPIAKQTPSKTNAKKNNKGKESPSPAKKSTSKQNESPSPSKKGKGKDRNNRTPSPNKSLSGKRSSISSETKTPSGKESIVPEDSKLPETPQRPPSPEPGSFEWIFVEQHVDMEFVGVLLTHWEAIEGTYIASCKHIFRAIRDENESVLQYFHRTRKSYVEFLRRPDAKQIFVSEWQKDYNAFPEDIRSDEEAKAELHQRVQDLCDRLWDICDNRKVDAENERGLIMTEKWLEDHLGLLVNHFLSLMQTEVDRYQETCKMLKDYYVAMEGGVGDEKAKVLPETNINSTRLPLVDIPPSEPPVPPQQETNEEEQVGVVVSPTPSNATTPKMVMPPKTPEITHNDERNGRIPLIPRCGTASDNSPSRNDRKKTTPRNNKPSDEKLDSSPLPPPDLDEKLLQEGLTTALAVVENQLAYDLAEDELNDKITDRQDKVNELAKSSSKDKKPAKKDRKSPTKSKVQLGQVSPVQSTMEVVESVSGEDKTKYELNGKMKKEYKYAISVEGDGLQVRLEAVKAHGLRIIKKLKEKAESTYTDMDDWLGKRFLQEMESIDKMCEVVRQAIENEIPLQDASILEDKQFFIDDDLHVYKTPTPPITPPLMEEITPYAFTCLQIDSLHKQFRQVAPFSMISVKIFNDVMLNLPSLSVGSEELPDIWLNITSIQLEKLCGMISINKEYINWKSFLLLLAKPFTEPSLSDILETMSSLESNGSPIVGMVTKDDFMKTDIWLDRRRSERPSSGSTFDRIRHLKEIIFNIFSTESAEGYLLNYMDTLLYFVSSGNALEGLFSALCVVTKTTAKLPKYLEDNRDELDDIEDEEEEAVEDEELEVTIEQWVKVFTHGKRSHGGDHRFDVQENHTTKAIRESLNTVYDDLGFTPNDSVPLSTLWEHPTMKDLILSCTKYVQKDIGVIFTSEEAVVVAE